MQSSNRKGNLIWESKQTLSSGIPAGLSVERQDADGTVWGAEGGAFLEVLPGAATSSKSRVCGRKKRLKAWSSVVSSRGSDRGGSAFRSRPRAVQVSAGGGLRGGASKTTKWRERDRTSACGKVPEVTSEKRDAATVVDDGGARGARSVDCSVAYSSGGVGDTSAGERSAVAADRRKWALCCSGFLSTR
jgi:hypothetical protein